jgi:hypothetical protein
LSPWLNLAFVVTGIALLLSYLRLRSVPDLSPTALGKPIVKGVGIIELASAEDYVDKHYGISAIDYFIRALTRLPDHLSRVDETMHFSGRSGELQTKLTFRASTLAYIDEELEHVEPEEESDENPPTSPWKRSPSDGQEDVLLVPLVSARKGLLFDHFSAFDTSNATIPTLSQWEARGLLVVTIRTLLEKAEWVDSSQGIDQTRECPTMDRFDCITLVKDTVCVLAESGQTSISFEDVLTEVGQLISDGARLSDDWKHRIASLCHSLTESYVIVAEVPKPRSDNFILGYRHTIFPERLLRSPDQRRRAKHGLLPLTADASMTWPLQADSYHFKMTAPSGQYVLSHHLEELETNRVLRQEDFVVSGNQQYVRIYHEEAHSIAHLYIRRQATGDDQIIPHYLQDDVVSAQQQDTTLRDFKSVVEFREVPPGALGNAVAVALLTAVIITYFALFRVGINPTNLGMSRSIQDIPALILTLPAFLVAAIGRSMGPDNLLRTTLTAFYGLWLIVSLSILAVLMYIYSANNVLPLEVTISVFGTDLRFNLFWIALSLSTIGLYLYLRKRKNDEREYYLELLDRVAIDKQLGKSQNEGRS